MPREEALEAARRYLKDVEARHPFEGPDLDCYAAELVCRALLAPHPEAGGEAERDAVLDRYRYAIRWVAADSWDHCSDCRERLEWARQFDPVKLTTDEFAAISKRYYRENGIQATAPDMAALSPLSPGEGRNEVLEEAAGPVEIEVRREVVAERVVRDVAELPGRSSDGEPQMMLVSQEELFDVVVAALSSQSVPEEWRDISSAPKGKKVLAGYYNALGKWRTVTARYYPANTLEIYDGEGFAEEGWYEESETHEELLPLDKPTHWQPLPSPPESADHPKGEG